MLVSFSLENFAIMDQLTLEPASGLTVLTGETGAGKSIMVEAMGLLLGGRASAEFIRAGASRAVVEGVFTFRPGDPTAYSLESIGMEVPEDCALLLSREITSEGKNTCRINGRQVTLNMYQEVARTLVDIHGQHEQQSLFSTHRQLILLDAFGGPQLVALREETALVYRQWQDLQARQRELEKGREARSQELELRRYQLEEIDRAGLVPGEKQALEEERRVLAQAERLQQETGEILHLLRGSTAADGAGDYLGQVVNRLEKLVAIDTQLGDWTEQLRQALYQVEDAAAELRRYQEQIEFNPRRMEDITERLDLLSRLERKYGLPVEELLDLRKELAAGLETWEEEEQAATALQAEIEMLSHRYYDLAGELGRRRREAAARLEAEVSSELAGLHMGGARVTVAFSPVPLPRPYGLEEVEFLLAANPGEPARPLAKVASGGELSRIMLALKSCLAAADNVPTLIFDEIDAGIGGLASQAVGNKLAELARVHQVLCVTHLPQIASFADLHCAVTKETRDGRTTARVTALGPRERAAEIARMLAGEVTPIALRHAEEMLAAAGSIRNTADSPWPL